MQPHAAPLILTATMEPRAAERFEAERRAYFPPERLVVGAHLTMFHHLPGPRAPEVAAKAREAARHWAPMEARARALRFLGRGTAYALESPELEDARAWLADAFAPDLLPQDAQRWMPHVTVANKLDGAKAKAVHAELSARFAPFSFGVTGLRLWRYDGGPWTALGAWAFGR